MLGMMGGDLNKVMEGGNFQIILSNIFRNMHKKQGMLVWNTLTEPKSLQSIKQVSAHLTRFRNSLYFDSSYPGKLKK